MYLKFPLLLAWSASLVWAANEPNRSIEMKDIAGWKRIVSPAFSPDGQWMAYRLSPNEGDSDVIVRSIRDGKESKYPAGESPAPAGGFGAPVGGNANLAFSEDSKYVAFTVYPTEKEAKRLKKDRKPAVNKVLLVELASAKKTEFERVRRFAFSGERGGWLAVHRVAAEGQKWQGSDLLLTELATGSQLNIGNVSEFAFDKKGDWLAFVVDAQDMVGNGVQLRNMATGSVMPLDSAKAAYKSLTWTETGDGLAVLRGVEDKGFEDKLYAVVGFTQFGGGAPAKTVFDPKQEKSFPAGMTVSPNRAPVWTKDLSALVFGIHETKAKKKDSGAGDAAAAPAAPPATAPAGGAARSEDDKERADLVLWHWLDKRLQSMQQVQEQMDKNFSYTSLYRVAEKQFLRLADEQLRQVTIPEPHVWGIGTDVSKYELQANLNGQRYSDLYAVNLRTGERKMLLEKVRYYWGASPDGGKIAYSDDGHFLIKDIATGEVRNVTKSVTATVFWDQEDDHNTVKPPTRFVGWTTDSSALLVSDNWDMWLTPWSGKPVNLTVNGKKDKIRYRNRFRLDPEEKGIDLQAPVYIATYGEWTKKSGIARLDPGAKAPRALLWDDAVYASLVKAKSAEAYFYTRETGSDFPDYFAAASGSLDGAKRVTEANPQQKQLAWSSGVKLLDYTSAKGDKLQGALHLPANYEPGKKYPTIVYIYEKLSQGANAYTSPSSNGFNKSVYTSNGYAVLMPDITYKLNDPGMSAVWCILPALEAAVASGVVDKDRVGLHGHSWGGYQTAFLVTQTDAFQAAVAGAPLTDMISMYSSIYWNTGSANQPIFESSQGRFTSSYLDNMDAYVRNSPVFHARKVKTPLMILHNDKDGAVDFTQGIEYYNTLRRLQKQVILLQYKGENHGLRTPANQKDYTVRMKEFFDHHLKGAAAPKWMQEGVPHLKVKEHLDERNPDPPAPAKAPTPSATEPPPAGGDSK